MGYLVIWFESLTLKILTLCIDTEVLTALSPAQALLEPLHGGPRHPDCHGHRHREHYVGGDKRGGVVGAGALAVQETQAGNQHVCANHPKGLQAVSWNMEKYE